MQSRKLSDTAGFLPSIWRHSVGILDLFRRKPEVRQAKSLEDWVEWTVRSSETVVSTLSPSQTMELVRRATQWVMICADRNASTCAGIPIRMYTTRGGSGAKSLSRKRQFGRRAMASKARGGQEVKEVENHPLLDLLRSPNPYMTGQEAAYFRFLSKEITGNAYLYLSEGEAMLPLWPQWVNIVPSRDDGLIQAFTYSRGDTAVRIDAEEIYHTRFQPSLFSPYYGASPLQSIFREADMYLYSTESENSRWKNEGRPPYAIELQPGANPDQRKQIIAEIERSIKGVKNAGRGIALAAAKITPLGWSPKEMEFIQGLERLEKTIWAAYAIPESVLRPNEGSLAAAAVGYPGWMKAGIVPRLQRDADDLTYKLMPRFGVDPKAYWFEYDSPSQAEDLELSKAQVIRVEAGLMTVNEARTEYGEEPVEDDIGDVLRYHGTPLKSEAEEAATTPAADAMEGEGDVGGLKPEEEAKSKRRKTRTEEAAFQSAIERWFSESISLLTLEEGSISQQRWDILYGIVKSNLSTIYGVAVDMTLDSLVEKGRKVPAFIQAAIASQAIIEKHASLVIEEVRATTYNDIRIRIQEGLAEGKTISEIQQGLIEDGYPAKRAECIARTETANALGAGRQVAMKEAGASTKSWALAGEACPSCEGFAEVVDGMTIGVDQPFAVAGFSWLGTDGKSYSTDRNVYHEPLHPNCRCTAIYGGFGR